MYNFKIHNRVSAACEKQKIETGKKDKAFFTRLVANTTDIHKLFMELYGSHSQCEAAFDQMVATLIATYKSRPAGIRLQDLAKEGEGNWFLSNLLNGMSVYVDRFCGQLADLPGKLDYLEQLGINLLHVMPVFQSPEGESDGGYAVSDFRKVDKRFGTLADLQSVEQSLHARHMYLMLDIVLNHTSHRHDWAEKAKSGDPVYQDYFYMYDDRQLPDRFDENMPDIFPESSPGNFTWVSECNKWVMTVFHSYQWDLNYTNPSVFNAMLETILFYANIGVDILRIDAPAFIWKELGTPCQNLPKAHTLLMLIKQCVQVSATGMALLGEAIVAPSEIMKYFGTGQYTAHECDLAYNATQMALQWDALATGDTRIMLAAQEELLTKPFGASWITYTRCHDDIGLGYDDSVIRSAGFNAYAHRSFLKDYYAGIYPGSPSTGALFSFNPKTQDARISGTLASLCGLEKALAEGNSSNIEESIRKIILMQAQACFIGGIPMFFYGDEAGYINDYSYLNDVAKNYDNRWMHRPVINWDKNLRKDAKGTVEEKIFSNTKRLIALRKKLPLVADIKNLTWLPPYSIHAAGFLRAWDDEKLYCLFNFSAKNAFISWHAFKCHGKVPGVLYDHWKEKAYAVGEDHDYLVIEPYSFCIMEAR